MGVITSLSFSLSLICIPLTAATASGASVRGVLSGTSIVPYCDMCVVVTCVTPFVSSPNQAWSPILHGSTSCSPPATISTWPPARHRDDCSPGRTTGGPSWIARGSDGGRAGGWDGGLTAPEAPQRAFRCGGSRPPLFARQLQHGRGEADRLFSVLSLASVGKGRSPFWPHGGALRPARATFRKRFHKRGRGERGVSVLRLPPRVCLDCCSFKVTFELLESGCGTHCSSTQTVGHLLQPPRAREDRQNKARHTHRCNLSLF